MKPSKFYEWTLIIVLVVSSVSLIIYASYYTFFVEQECTEELKTIEEIDWVAYGDTGKLIFSFGDERVLATSNKNNLLIGETLTIKKCEKLNGFLGGGIFKIKSASVEVK